MQKFLGGLAVGFLLAYFLLHAANQGRAKALETSAKENKPTDGVYYSYALQSSLDIRKDGRLQLVRKNEVLNFTWTEKDNVITAVPKDNDSLESSLVLQKEGRFIYLQGIRFVER